MIWILDFKFFVIWRERGWFGIESIGEVRREGEASVSTRVFVF